MKFINLNTKDIIEISEKETAQIKRLERYPDKFQKVEKGSRKGKTETETEETKTETEETKTETEEK